MVRYQASITSSKGCRSGGDSRKACANASLASSWSWRHSSSLRPSRKAARVPPWRRIGGDDRRPPDDGAGSALMSQAYYWPAYLHVAVEGVHVGSGPLCFVVGVAVDRRPLTAQAARASRRQSLLAGSASGLALPRRTLRRAVGISA